MRLRCFAIACAVIACASLYTLLSQPPVPGDRPVSVTAATPIDFDALHTQAKAALAALQQSRGPRVASAAAAGF